jgi:hypothetical protein
MSIDVTLQRFQTAVEAALDRNDPKPMVARVEFVGETDLHVRLAADPEQLKESVRSTAITHFGDRTWIEKVTVGTRPQTGIAADPGPLLELRAMVDALAANDDDLLALGQQLSALFQKLPPDYRQGDARIKPDDPKQMRERVIQAHALLAQRLKKEAAGP